MTYSFRDICLQLRTQNIEKVNTKQNRICIYQDLKFTNLVEFFERNFSDKVQWDNAYEFIPKEDHYNYSQDLKILKLHILNQFNDRFITLSDRKNMYSDLIIDSSWHNSSFDQGFTEPMMWKGKPLHKTVYDFSILQLLLWELKPKTIIEFGSGNGSSAEYMNDLCSIYNSSCKIISFDITNSERNQDSIEFYWADCSDISTIDQHKNKFKNLEHPILFIEDSHINTFGVLTYFTEYFSVGDYVYVEDLVEEQDRDVSNWYSNDFMVDRKYVDYFGVGNSCANYAIFKKVK
jgi:hypothetical protein